MASGQPGEAVRLINRLFREGTVGALTDGQLLERFATRRGEAAEAAFEALVSRHGPMVLRVARGMLRDPHDVDDAFQATFLVLVRKAGSIGERELLGPWLYGVAHRVALKARAVAARRSRREGGIADDPPDDVAEGPWLDLRPVLHEELNRLPEKYRKPVVLCHLQGLTHAEAAVELAWPVGTVSVRLARARKLLKERLTRRGLTVTASLWGAGLAAEGASAAVPESLIRSTALAAIQYAAGRSLVAGTVSAGAAVIAKRTLTMMLMSRLKWLIVPLAVGAGAAGGVVATRQVMIRSIEARERDKAKELASAQAPKPPAAETVDPSKIPLPESGQSPFDLSRSPFEGAVEPPAGIEQVPIKAEPPVVAIEGGRFEIGPVPPGYFDLPALAKKDGTEPPVVKPGHILAMEVLEALPGRPITGERVVRPDGTISLGFYGDLPVAGLNRDQIKVRLVERLRKFISDDILGLVVIDSKKNVARAVPPVETNRVFVDDSSNYYPVGREIPDRPKVREGLLDPYTKDRLDEVEAKLDRVLKELEDIRGGRRPAGPGEVPPAKPAEVSPALVLPPAPAGRGPD